MSSEWGTMTPEQKSTYDKQSTEDKGRYNTEMKSYNLQKKAKEEKEAKKKPS